MAEINRSCSLCKGDMEEGFIADRTYGAVDVSGWVEGQPVRSFWTGIKMGGKDTIAITTYRCTNCGHLESFAKGDRSAWIS